MMQRTDEKRTTEARALRKKAKRLRILAQDVGDAHRVRKMSRDFDAAAAAIEHGTGGKKKPRPSPRRGGK